jgi:anti-sigma factor RsiW
MRPVGDLACQDFVELVTAYLDGALPNDLAALVERHVQECAGCREYLAQMRLTIGAVRRLPGALPADVREELLRRARVWWSEREG